MEQKNIVKFCKDLGCCDTCCIRYLGLKHPSSYENVHQFVKNLCPNLGSETQDVNLNINSENKLTNIDVSGTETDSICVPKTQNGEAVIDNTHTSEPLQTHRGKANDDSERDNSMDAPPAKRIKLDDVCVSCLGVLQEETWPEGFAMFQDVLNKKGYQCGSVACALSSPLAVLVRERALTAHLEDAFPGYDHQSVMPLKEAWKWTFGRRAAALLGKRLDSGAVAPLLLTLTVEYPDEAAELEAVRALAPAQFEARGRQRRRFAVEFTRRAVEQALGGAAAGALRALGAPSRAAAPARPLCVQAVHAPLYVGGRYVKLSRALPQTPWVVAGRRIMHSSVQEIICEPLAALYGLVQAEGHVKLVCAGREDVDVRCLGTGRPFAVEISDPRRAPSPEELRRVCEQISADGKVTVERLVPVAREALTQLKQGEQTKCKTYEALCVKLDGAVSPGDLERVCSYSNTGGDGGGARVVLQQRTPLRVLHRRALLVRSRRVLALSARAVPSAPQLFVVRVRTEAGTYVKEWAHGELRRTRPCLADALGARADILALDVHDVELPWPPAALPALPTPPAPTDVQ